MLSLLLSLSFGAALFLIARALRTTRGTSVPLAIVAGYALRVLISLIVRNVSFFAHGGGGGDSLLYEDYAKLIAHVWEVNGFHYVDADEMPMLGATTLLPNLYAIIFYFGGELASVGCVALVAFATALLFLNMYSLAVEEGAEPRNAQTLTLLLYFSPLVLYYTSDTYKDGLVASLTFGALATSVRMSRRLSVGHAILGALCLWALWYVRFYLVFVAVAPLVVGLVGIGSKSIFRQLMAALTLLVAILAVAAFTDVLQHATEQATETFVQGTARNVLDANASGGSGVEFDDGGQAFGALGPKLAYTLFSPFPWSGGSLGFQIGKLDVLLWYYVLYRTGRSIVNASATQRSLILMLATFLIPCTIMYATSVSNVGLIVRQRLIIVLTTAVIAMVVSAKEASAVTAPATADSEPTG